MNRRPKMSTPGRTPPAPSVRRTADFFVAIAMGLVVLALATAANQHFSVDLDRAVTAGVAAYAVLLAIHLFSRRRARSAVASPQPAAATSPFSSRRPPALREPSLSHGDADTPPAATNIGQVPLPSLAADGHPIGHRPNSEPRATEAGPPPIPRVYRPAPVATLTADGNEPAEAPSFEQTLARSSLDQDVERMQMLVKQLAESVSEQPEQRQVYGRTPRLSADAVADSSVNVLRHTAQGMRNALAPTPKPTLAPQKAAPSVRIAPAQTSPPPAPPKLSETQSHIAAVADALVAGRVEVELEPVLSLLDRRTRHYEVSVQVRATSGELLASNNEFNGLRGTGLLPLFDSARLQRSVGIAQRLVERQKTGRVFSSYSVESLTNISFLADARAALNDQPDVARQLVIGIPQIDIRGLQSADWAALAEMRQMQVTLAIDRLIHLDVDLKQMAMAGFAFARVDATTFLSGLNFGGRKLAAADVARYVTASGMTLVVENIDDETSLQHVAGVGAQLGLGRVFGGRRAVKVKTDTAAA